ncbi:pyocin knob domain-containing protein, partial [Chitinophaga sp.]|uniref:pyocin knob domain-containing protein n=1 Tax=Chitinophaga sp. TaxID=1869181 RepID=UPI002C585E4E
ESGKGHNSRNVIVEGNVIRRADAVGIKCVNGINVMVSNNFINYAKTRSISMDSGDGYVDSLGNPLYARFNIVISNRISDTANIFIGADSSVVAKNFSTHGPASLNVSSSSTWVDPSNATDYLTLIKTVDGSGSGLDADLFDGRESNTFFSNSFTAFTDFNSATGNAVYDVSNFQPSNRPPSGNYFSLMNIDNSSANNNRFQMAWQLGTQNIYTRNQSGGTWSGWNTLYHNGNANLSTVSWSTSSIAISGAVSMPYTTISANTTLDGTHRTVSTSTSGITVTLPSASSATNRIYEIRNASAGNITISPVQVWGTTTTTIPTVTSWCIQSDGTNWILLSRSN